jgi:hypothetical protein
LATLPPEIGQGMMPIGYSTETNIIKITKRSFIYKGVPMVLKNDDEGHFERIPVSEPSIMRKISSLGPAKGGNERRIPWRQKMPIRQEILRPAERGS